MKARFCVFLGLLFGFCTFGAVAGASEPIMVSAEDEPEVFECSVVIENTEHGSISVDKEEGHVGETVTITAKHDLFYLVEFVKVNDTALVESETTSGEYKFVLVEGENKITSSFAVDKELLGEMSIIYEQAMNKDWTNLFSVENVIRIVTFILNGGLLIAIVRYFVKDKFLEKKLENKVVETMNNLVPQTTRDTVVTTIQEVIAPMFNKLQADNVEVVKALGVYAKCTALAQENTPESRKAILDEIASLRIADLTTVESVRNYIEQQVAHTLKEYEDVLSRLTDIAAKSEKILGNTETVKEETVAEENTKQEATVEKEKEENVSAYE